MNAHPQASRLRLLLDLEPAHRVFFRNLSDTLLHRTVPRTVTTSRPGLFWNDVFIYTAVPWRSFFESILWHVLVVAALWGLFWRTPSETAQHRMFRESHISYYPPHQSFPTAESRRARVRPQPRAQTKSAHQQKIVVTPERSAHSLVLPPDLNLAQSRRSNAVALRIAASNPAIPAMPLSATGHSRRPMSAGLASAVAPLPDFKQATARRLGLQPEAAVAPAPQVGPASARQAVTAPNAAVVAPPPLVQGSIRRVGDVNIGRSSAVAPAPQLPMPEQRTVPGGAQGLAGTSAAVVPPPPSVGGSGTLENARGRPLSKASLQAVPPAPSIGGQGNASGGRRVSSLSNAGTRVVPPAPAVDGGGNATAGRATSLSGSGAGAQAVPPAPSLGSIGNSAGEGRTNTMSNAGIQAVPPTPAVDGAGNSGAGGRASPLSGAGMQVVPPAPSLNGESRSGLGGTGNLSTAGMRVVPPSPAVDGTGNSGGSGLSTTMNIPQEVAPPPQAAADDRSQPVAQELPVNLIGLVLALPGTSYFSNYEVFVARRRLSKDETALIKLVYEFLPYQSRLSEIGLKNAKVYKLTVVRDTTCDETLMQMLHPQIDESHPGTKYSFDPTILGPNDPNSVLPCYRTTADDFRKAVSRSR